MQQLVHFVGVAPGKHARQGAGNSVVAIDVSCIQGHLHTMGWDGRPRSTDGMANGGFDACVPGVRLSCHCFLSQSCVQMTSSTQPGSDECSAY